MTGDRRGSVFPPVDTQFTGLVYPRDDQLPHRILVMHGGRVLDRRDAGGDWRALSEDEAGDIVKRETSRHFLGEMDGETWLVVEVDDGQGASFVDLRTLGAEVSADWFNLIGRAVQVIDWARSHRFCGRCGEPTKPHPRDRAMVCNDCNLTCYPRLSPSIIALVHRGDEVLLARNNRFPEGMYSTLAGFVEPGENVEETLHREIFEEVGVRVSGVRYLGSQPWPFPNSLMLGFHAEWESGDLHLQEEEIADAQWFDVRQLPAIPGALAISRWLIDAYLRERAVI